MDDDKRRDNGMTQRRKVLGNEWVDKSIANRNAFNTEFQDLITRVNQANDRLAAGVKTD